MVFPLTYVSPARGERRDRAGDGTDKIPLESPSDLRAHAESRMTGRESGLCQMGGIPLPCPEMLPFDVAQGKLSSAETLQHDKKAPPGILPFGCAPGTRSSAGRLQNDTRKSFDRLRTNGSI